MGNRNAEVGEILLKHRSDALAIAQGKSNGKDIGTSAAEAQAAIEALIADAEKVDGNTSDGYHTFNELYDFRLLYNAAFFNQLMSTDIPVAKSKLHADGTEPFGGGWFIVHAHLPTGDITNHYELKDWDLFHITEIDRAPEWDGHTPQDVAKRLREYLSLAQLQAREEKRK
jgi:hypothetical protein